MWQIICALLGKYVPPARKDAQIKVFVGIPINTHTHCSIHNFEFCSVPSEGLHCALHSVQMHHLICTLVHILPPAPIPPLNEHPLRTKPGIFAPAPVSRAGGGQDQRPRHSTDHQRLESMGAQNLDQGTQLI